MGLTQNVFKHTVIYSFASIIGKAVGFIMLPFYAHFLQGAGYGIIGMTDAALSLLMNLFCYGLTGSVIRFYHEEEVQNKYRVVSTAIILIGITSLVVCGLLTIISPYISKILFGNPSYYLLVSMALASFMFDLTANNAATLLLIEQRSVLFSGIGVLRLFVALSLNILFIVILRLGVTGYFLSEVLTAAVFSVVFHAIVIPTCGIRYDRGLARKIIRFEAPLIPGNIVSFASSQAERILVRFLVSLEGVGILEMGYKFTSILSLLISEPFFKSWNTKRTEMAEGKGAPEQIGKMFTLFLFVLTAAGLFLSSSVKELIEILTPKEFWPSYRVAKIEILTMILTGSYYHLYFGLYYKKQTNYISLIRSVVALVKIPISFVLINAWGIYGAAYSACLVAALQLVWATRKAQSLYPLAIEYGKIVAIVSVALIIEVALSQIDFGRMAISHSVRYSVLQPLFDGISATRIGQWKSGIIPCVLSSKSDQIINLMMHFLSCIAYLGLFPFIIGVGRLRYFRHSKLGNT